MQLGMNTVCVCVCVCVGVRACVRVRACVCVCVWIWLPGRVSVWFVYFSMPAFEVWEDRAVPDLSLKYVFDIVFVYTRVCVCVCALQRLHLPVRVCVFV